MPTLYQLYSGYSAILGRASRYGAGYPENANIVFAAGPDDRIGPERPENLTMSAHLTPARGLEFTAAWYRIDYSDRVAPPIASPPGGLGQDRKNVVLGKEGTGRGDRGGAPTT